MCFVSQICKHLDSFQKSFFFLKCVILISTLFLHTQASLAFWVQMMKTLLMKRESKSRRKHQWRERQISDGETRRNWKKALSLLEEEVWRKGLGKTEGSGFNLTSLFLPVLLYFSPFKQHSCTPSVQSPIMLTQPVRLTPTPSKCQGLPEKALIWWYSLCTCFLCPSAAQVERKRLMQTVH